MNDPLVISQLGDPVLRQTAKPVTDFDCADLDGFVDALLAAMFNKQGVGIAAPQVGHSLQLMVIASRPNPRYPDAVQMDPLVMVNPQVLGYEGQIESDWEGCLSVPGIRGYVPRYQSVKVRYQDRKGVHHQCQFDGFVARIFQHEMDHLLGLSFVDRVASTRHLIAESLLGSILSGELAFKP